MFFKNVSMTRFELRTTGVGSNCSANWATPTAHIKVFLPKSVSENFLRFRSS